MPLLGSFGASNELPEEEELTALYDRFLVRFVVNYIAEDFRFLRMLEAPPQSERTCLTLGAVQKLQRGARDVIIPPHAYLEHRRYPRTRKTFRPPTAAIASV